MKILSLIDDSGLMALVDVSAYPTFVDEEWTYETIIQHFREAMARGEMLVWDCGDGGDDYRVQIRQGWSDLAGFRVAEGGIVARDGRLHLCSYTALTMAAQFSDEVLPAETERNLVIKTTPGSIKVRVVQMHDPDSLADWEGPHFVIEIEPGDALSWTEVAWHRGSAP